MGKELPSYKKTKHFQGNYDHGQNNDQLFCAGAYWKNYNRVLKLLGNRHERTGKQIFKYYFVKKSFGSSYGKKAWIVQVVERTQTQWIIFCCKTRNGFGWSMVFKSSPSSVLMLCKKQHGLHDDHNLSKLQSGDIHQTELKLGFCKKKLWDLNCSSLGH